MDTQTKTGISTDVETPLSAAIKRAEKAEAENAALRERVAELEAEIHGNWECPECSARLQVSNVCWNCKWIK